MAYIMLSGQENINQSDFAVAFALVIPQNSQRVFASSAAGSVCAGRNGAVALSAAAISEILMLRSI